MAIFTPMPLGDSTDLRRLIQSVESSDTINLTIGASTASYSVTTLAKIPCIPGSNYVSGYTINGVAQNRSTLVNTRIYQENIDGFYAPNLVSNVKFNYTSGSNAILRATQGTYTLNTVMIEGNHSGWAGNGGVYMSLTTSNGATPITANLSISNSDIVLNSNAQTNGTASFLQSWNNNGTVNISGTLFNEAAYNRGSFHFASMNGNSGNLGTYSVSGSTFAGNGTLKSNSNRLESVNATISGSSFESGSYLDLAGNLNGITINAGNTFKTVYGDTTLAPYAGSGIRFTRLSSSTATLSGTPTVSGNFFEGWGLAISNNDSVPGSGGSIITTGSNRVSLGMFGSSSAITDTFARLSAGGIAADTINYGGSTDKEWISGGAGADSITGGTVSDFIIGGVGADTIATGTGSDTVVYYATNEGADTITDFATGTDKLAFRGNSPGGSGFFNFAPGTNLNGSNFITTGGPTTANPTFIFLGGILSYDADGNGGGSAVNIATLTSGTLVASDIKFF